MTIQSIQSGSGVIGVIGAFLFVSLVGCGERGGDADLNPMPSPQAAATSAPMPGDQSSKEQDDDPVGVRRKLTARFENYFVTEKRDSIWAATREEQIRAAVADIRNAAVISSECRNLLCKIQVSFSTGNDQRDFRENLLNTPAYRRLLGGGVNETWIGEPQSRTTTWWISRPGYTLPLRDGVAPLSASTIRAASPRAPMR